MSTPVPLESRNYVDSPRPFKNPNHTRNTYRRTKTLKQILAAEREAALGAEGSGSGKRKGKKSAVSALLSGNGLENETGASSTQASRAGSADIVEGDTAMASATDVTTEQSNRDVEAAAAAAAAALAKRKRDLPSYSSVEAPPSLRPRKKFCDITGLLVSMCGSERNGLGIIVHLAAATPGTLYRSQIAPALSQRRDLQHHQDFYRCNSQKGPGIDQAYLNLRGESSQIK
ncbi:hypothetical protein CBS101457_000776 [Exobasidium rhododendri]|nr:hypothetical protein CBS101457_000776 [Exobasidium rhododendri]